MSINKESVIVENLKNVKHSCPECYGQLKQIKGKFGVFWSCNNYKEGCKFSTNDNDGSPAEVFKCPKCDRKLRRLAKDDLFFWGCSGFKDGCKTSFKDVGGKPDMSVITLGLSEFKCSSCDRFLRKVKGKNGWFWSCSGYKDGCSKTFKDVDDKPQLDK
jgi:ssDNA-binding Zn-finger/Zn-ribbon topoisomerase 1